MAYACNLNDVEVKRGRSLAVHEPIVLAWVASEVPS